MKDNKWEDTRDVVVRYSLATNSNFLVSKSSRLQKISQSSIHGLKLVAKSENELVSKHSQNLVY